MPTLIVEERNKQEMPINTDMHRGLKVYLVERNPNSQTFVIK